MAGRKKVAILYGGRSVEHAVSVNSARNIYEYIDRKKFEPVAIGIAKSGEWFLTPDVTRDMETGTPLGMVLKPGHASFIDLKDHSQFSIDIAFPVLHGTDGEDGSIQGMLKAMDIPMVGTGVLGSALSMNKIVAKRLLQEVGLPVTEFLTFRYDEQDKISYASISRKLGVPFMVKSASLGSSVGVTKVKSKKDFKPAIAEAFKYDDELLVEAYVDGREIECALLGNNPAEPSYPGEIVISKAYEFYTFDAKYVDPNAVRIDVPAKLSKSTAEKIRKVSKQAFEALHCEDFSRIDLFLDKKGKVYINEVNTIPGFTNSSMYPMMWRERGLSFTALISKLLTLAQQRYNKGKRIERDFQSALKF